MDMDRIRNLIIGFALVSLIAASGAIALDAFQSDQVTGTTNCNATSGDYSGCPHAWNISQNGLIGIDNTTSYFGTAGTIAGVALLLTIVIGAFYFVTRQGGA